MTARPPAAVSLDAVAAILQQLGDRTATEAFAASLTAYYPDLDRQAFLASAGYTPAPPPAELTADDIDAMVLRVEDPTTCQTTARAAG